MKIMKNSKSSDDKNKKGESSQISQEMFQIINQKIDSFPEDYQIKNNTINDFYISENS